MDTISKLFMKNMKSIVYTGLFTMAILCFTGCGNASVSEFGTLEIMENTALIESESEAETDHYKTFFELMENTDYQSAVQLYNLELAGSDEDKDCLDAFYDVMGLIKIAWESSEIEYVQMVSVLSIFSEVEDKEFAEAIQAEMIVAE